MTTLTKLRIIWWAVFFILLTLPIYGPCLEIYGSHRKCISNEMAYTLDWEILNLLNNEPRETATAASITLALMDRFNIEDIHAALWRLLNEGKLEWTPDFCFRVAEKSI